MAMGVAQGGGRGRRRGRGRRAPVADINVTPLVDVMLVLLIVFMVTAPLLTAAVPIDLPDSRARAADNQTQGITISIDGGGTVFIDQDPVPAGDLAAALVRLPRTGAAGAGGPEITLRADRALDYGRVMAVMGELNRAGLNRIALVTNGSATAP